MTNRYVSQNLKIRRRPTGAHVGVSLDFAVHFSPHSVGEIVCNDHLRAKSPSISCIVRLAKRDVHRHVPGEAYTSTEIVKKYSKGLRDTSFFIVDDGAVTGWASYLTCSRLI